MASNKTKEAIMQLTGLLKDGVPLPLEIIYSSCGYNYDTLAAALSSLIEKEEIRIGRFKSGGSWFIGNNGRITSGKGEIWHTGKAQMRKVLPKLLKVIRKYQGKETTPPDDGIKEQLNTVRTILEDGKPRSKPEIIAATGLEDIDKTVWRHFPQLPDGRFTLPDSKGAFDFLYEYLREKPRRLSDLLRLFRRHKKIIEKITTQYDQAPLIRLPKSLITTTDSPEGRDELERRKRIKSCREILESLPEPFFDPQEAGLGMKEFEALADSYCLPVSFGNRACWCLRREFPGDVLIEQLGEICGRYFAPPYTASAPSFLREHSLGEKEAAGILGVDDETLSFLISAGHLGSFTLDGKTRLWRSDIYELNRNGARLRELIKQHEKFNIPQAAAFLGISTGQVRRLIQEGKLAVVPAKESSGADIKLMLRKDLEALRQELPAITLGWEKAHEKEQGGTLSKGEKHSKAKKKAPRRIQEQLPAKELVLDDFQIEASEALQAGLSVIVSAPTGNGKTLVAEMLARDVMASGLGMIYTSPLKALSNQKYRDFKKLFGDDQVGLVTGDVSINPGAPMLIMTTEIFRNWCLSEPGQLEKISYVVFDEIHYLDDTERGTTWEESILFAPGHVKILGLSATVPNADEMADWISSVRGGNVVVIMEKKRRVPLSTQWILPNGQIVGEKKARSEVEELVEYLRALKNKKHWFEELHNVELQEVSCSEIIESIQDKLPALFFVFSRGRTELLAQELGHDWDFLNTAEKREVAAIIREAEAEQPGAFSSPGWRNLRRLLLQGIAYHHAGLLPPVKYLVEKLYASRMLWVVFCTETFAAGVNFPAASAVFDSTRKWDGHDFRILQNREFFQMAGRAGRRGFDKTGHTFIRVDTHSPEQTGFFNDKEIEPVSGRLVISPNTVLSLLRYKTDEEIDRFLNENFRMYQLKKRQALLEEEIKLLDAQISGTSSALCPESGKLTCPVERNRARNKLKHLRWKNRNREKELLQKQLAITTTKKCPDFKKCTVLLEQLRRARLQRQSLREEYAATTRQVESLFTEYEEVRDLLENLGYIKGREFFARGNFALELHVQEILVTEIAFSGLLEDTTPAEAAAILAGVEYIPGKNTRTASLELPALKETLQLRHELLKMGVPERFCIWSNLPGSLAYAWYNGASFAELLEMTSLQPGDIFSIFRREIDLLRQIERAAAGNTSLIERVQAIRKQLDRDEIALSF